MHELLLTLSPPSHSFYIFFLLHGGARDACSFPWSANHCYQSILVLSKGDVYPQLLENAQDTVSPLTREPPSRSHYTRRALVQFSDCPAVSTFRSWLSHLNLCFNDAGNGEIIVCCIRFSIFVTSAISLFHRLGPQSSAFPYSIKENPTLHLG